MGPGVFTAICWCFDFLVVFDDADIDLNQPIVASCLRGLTAAGVVAAAHILGKDDVPLYVVSDILNNPLSHGGPS